MLRVPNIVRISLWPAAIVMLAGPVHAQFGRGIGDWMTGGGDAQRSSWIRTDGKISKDALQKPGFEFLWKLKLDNIATQPFGAPLLLNSYIGYRGFRSLAFFGLSSDKVVAVDTDLGRIEWRKQLGSGASASSCAAETVAMTRQAIAAFPASGGGRGFGGRGGPARSGVGEPDEGAVTLKQTFAPPGPGGPPVAPAMPGAPAGRPAPPAFPPGFGRTPTVLYAVARDGMIHTMYVSNGETPQPPTPFVPANTRLFGLIVIDNVAYAAAAPDCGAAPDSLVALDLGSKKMATFKPDRGTIAGSLGASIGPDGTLYIATTAGEIVALEPKTLTVKGTYKGGEPFASSPVIFEYKNKALIAAAAKDGSIHLLDTAGLGGTPLLKSSAGNSVISALESWQDLAGTRWLVGQGNDAVMAWKLADRNSGLSLEPGWISHDVTAPLAPIIINGVVFAASTGSKPALYALDGSTGKTLWHNSNIGPLAAGGGLSVGNSQVYLGTNDGSLYVFGFPMEH